MSRTIHEQIQKQLEYLKTWVDGEEKHKKDCEDWKIPYTPSNRKWEDERQYKEYLKEIETNGDKNLLVMVKMQSDGMYGVYPFARRYADDWEHLVYRTKHGTEILVKRSDCIIVNT